MISPRPGEGSIIDKNDSSGRGVSLGRGVRTICKRAYAFSLNLSVRPGPRSLLVQSQKRCNSSLSLIFVHPDDRDLLMVSFPGADLILTSHDMIFCAFQLE